MRKMMLIAAAVATSTPAVAAQTLSSGWEHDGNLLVMDSAEASALIKRVGYQDWTYLDPTRSVEWPSAFASALPGEGTDTAEYLGIGGPLDDGDMLGHDSHQGMGGPIESQSGYPPCDPGPGDDECIQLYERGVTGAGN